MGSTPTREGARWRVAPLSGGGSDQRAVVLLSGVSGGMVSVCLDGDEAVALARALLAATEPPRRWSLPG